MNSIPHSYFERGILICYIILIPIYSFFFLIGFKPLHIDLWLQVPLGRLAFIAAIMVSIEMVVTLISRLFMLLTKNHYPITHFQYITWELVEAVAIAMFCTLFIWLLGKRAEPYFSILPSMCLISASILVFPYIIMSLIAELHDRNETLENKEMIIAKYASGQIGNESSPVHFRDMNNNLRLVVAAGLILYIEAANNYVCICYLKGDAMIKYYLRNRMKNIEETCSNSNLVRCHRSYFINLKHVRLIQKESDGMYAELEKEGAPHIPVSKTYAEQIIARMSAINDQYVS